MMTYKELLAFCEAKGIKYEVNDELSGNRWDDPSTRIVIGKYFGMCNIAGRKGKSEWQWVWFHCYEVELKDESVFFFEERYSQVCGRSYTGIMEGIHQEEIIRRRMEA